MEFGQLSVKLEVEMELGEQAIDPLGYKNGLYLDFIRPSKPVEKTGGR